MTFVVRCPSTCSFLAGSKRFLSAILDLLTDFFSSFFLEFGAASEVVLGLCSKLLVAQTERF